MTLERSVLDVQKHQQDSECESQFKGAFQATSSLLSAIGIKVRRGSEFVLSANAIIALIWNTTKPSTVVLNVIIEGFVFYMLCDAGVCFEEKLKQLWLSKGRILSCR